ncbi:MAG: ATP-binding protein [Rhodothermales bacterium]
MKRTSVRYVAVAAFLMALLGGTYAAQAWRLARIAAQGEAAQQAAAARAVRVVEREVERLEADLMQRAEALARLPTVRAALQDSSARGEAVRLFSELALPEGVAAELYTPTPELVAWKGPSLPFGPATRATRFLSTPQTSAVSDGALRQAIVVWLPVREGRRVTGAVRVLRLVETRVPVRNQYLRDFDLAEQWQAQAGIPIDVAFGAASGAAADSAMHLVSGRDGTVVARVTVSAPPLAALEEDVRREMGDVAAFWAVLLAGWVMAGLWMLSERALPQPMRRMEDEAPPRWGLATLSFAGASAAWWGLRYALLALGIPARWFAGSGALVGGASEVPLFDPVYLASGFGGGVLGSAGELIVTAVFAVVFGVAWLRFALCALRHVRSAERADPETPADPEERRSAVRWAAEAFVAACVGAAVAGVTALLIRRGTLDATLPYFDRTDAFPSALVMLVFGSFLLLVLTAMLVLTGLGVLVRVRDRRWFLGGAATVTVVLAATYALTDLGLGLPWPVAAAFFAVGGGAAWWMERGPDAWAGPLTLRGTLLAVLVLAALTYPIAYDAAQDKQAARIVDAAEEFADGEDARVAFALEGVLLDARASDAVHEALASRRSRSARTRAGAVVFDSLATDLVTGSLLAALADYTVALTVLGPASDTLGVYRELPPPGDPDFFGALGAADPLSFNALRRRYAADTAPGFVVERASAPEGRGKYRYAGIGPIRREDDGAILGWVTAQAEPKPARYVSETPFPRVLVPAGLTNVVESDLAFAEFRDGVLVRARGDDYGRFRLPAEVRRALGERDVVWRREQVGPEPVRVYYRRIVEADGRERVISVREPGVIVFDHLYFYLRLLLPALVLGLVAYALGVVARRRAGVLLRRSRLRDRVLNRFLVVGVASVVLTGLVGQQVVVVQNRQSVQEQLKRRLARVEAELFAEATARTGGSVPLYQLIDRARPDLVGPRLGLDVNLYRGADLIASSRSQLVRQQLIDRRLPADVYEALYVRGERYAFTEERIGTFAYTTGYEALPDATGRPGAVIAIPTLPEQTAIEADQARMIAYLFGVLLLLLVGIFLITTLLANRLTRPFRRLRAGLLAVGAGEELAEPIPVESSDEVGELIETFNAMRYQLEESRRKLAQQERELAWREMARQVAHEIKNPLTPMKLSVQHLRRAHRAEPEATGDGEPGRFSALLDRITGTLIEQIDALTRIANEFSSFARLPSRHLERLDLNAVIREAAALIGEEEHARIALALSDDPLPVTADREELRRVYINLFKNALQAMPEDEHGTVTVRSEQREGSAFSAVRDPGTGIPEEARAKVFQPNFSTKTSGMGLGLAITRKAVEDLHGEIHFETAVGVGTTFFVRLPLADEGDRDEGAAEEGEE